MRNLQNSVHEKSEYHQKNLSNGWKDEKEKKMTEHFQPKLLECKKLFTVRQNDLEKELKDIEEEHAKAEREYEEQQKEKKRERTDNITLQGRRRRSFLGVRKWKEEGEEKFVFLKKEKKKAEPTW